MLISQHHLGNSGVLEGIKRGAFVLLAERIGTRFPASRCSFKARSLRGKSARTSSSGLSAIGGRASLVYFEKSQTELRPHSSLPSWNRRKRCMPETYWDKSGRTDPCNQLQVIEKVILRAGRSNFPVDDRSSGAVYGIVALRDSCPVARPTPPLR